MANMNVQVHLRSVIKDKRECLAMFDSNGNGDINNLETEVHAGEKINWLLDGNSRIKKIVKIWSREENSKLFKVELTGGPQKDQFELQISESAEPGLEAYNIECLLGDDSNLVIDPYIRILPPPTRG